MVGIDSESWIKRGNKLFVGVNLRYASILFFSLADIYLAYMLLFCMHFYVFAAYMLIKITTCFS